MKKIEALAFNSEFGIWRQIYIPYKNGYILKYEGLSYNCCPVCSTIYNTGDNCKCDPDNLNQYKFFTKPQLKDEIELLKKEGWIISTIIKRSKRRINMKKTKTTNSNTIYDCNFGMWNQVYIPYKNGYILKYEGSTEDLCPVCGNIFTAEYYCSCDPDNLDQYKFYTENQLKEKLELLTKNGWSISICEIAY
jgi:hypothetical protein